MADDARGALEASRLPPETLTLDLTESLLATDADQIANALAELKAVGVRLLSYLAHFPLDILKIDRVFTAGISGSAEAVRLLSSIIRMARSRELTTVTEGIEDASQLARVRAFGADLGQGYHIAAPMPADAARRWWQHRSTSHTATG